MKSNSAVIEKKKKEKKQKTYQQYIFYKVIVIIVLVVVLLAVTIFAIHAGSSGISVWDVIKTIFGAGTKQTNSIVFGIRLPRVVTALIAGMALGMVGCVMQSVLRNPLADASTLGVSQGAAFGATELLSVLAPARKIQLLLQMQLTSAIPTWLLYVLLLGALFLL